MTVATQIDRSGPYAGAGTTGPFTVSFRFLDATHLQVIRTDSTGQHILALTTDYTVAGVGNPTGSVTLVAALPVGQTLTIIRKVPKTQEADYVQNSDFPAESHENALDKLTMISQETGEVVSRAITLPTSDSSLLVKELPIASLRAKKALVFDLDGSVGVSVDDYNDQVADVAASAAAAAASAAAAAASQSAAATSASSSASSAASAAASYDSFDDRYLGPKATAPTVDNDGNPLLTGALYWDTVMLSMRVYTGTQWVRLDTEIVTPENFGAVGNGVANDGPALNAALDYMRARIAIFTNSRTVIRLDLGGRTYKTLISINATGLLGDWVIRDGTIAGHCTGKPVLDTIGSRFGRLENLLVTGDSTNRPTVGIQAARSSVNPSQFGFCDGMLWDKVSTYGYFSVSAIHVYGQEGTTYNRCKFWNSDRDAYVGIHTGYSSVAMSSDYLTPTTGSVSYINNKYIGCDYLPLPEGENATITGITQANPAVVTAPGHPYSTGQVVTIGLVNGMTQINNVSAVVTVINANSFSLTGVNSTGFSAYTSGGWSVRARTKPTILFARGEQHHFDTCYVVNYGSDSFSIDFPDPQILKSVWLDILFEGQGGRSHVRFLNAGTIFDFRLETYNTHARDYVMSVDAATVGTVALYSGNIKVTNHSVSAPALVSDVTRFALYGSDVFVPNTTTFNTTTLSDRFTGTYGNTGSDTVVHVNSRFMHYQDGAYTPTVTAASGTITSYTATGNVRRVGDMAFVEMFVNITNAGTGAGGLNVSFPFTAVSQVYLNGREYGLTGASINGRINGGTTANVLKYDGTTIIATGAVLALSGWIRTA